MFMIYWSPILGVSSLVRVDIITKPRGDPLPNSSCINIKVDKIDKYIPLINTNLNISPIGIFLVLDNEVSITKPAIKLNVRKIRYPISLW